MESYLSLPKSLVPYMAQGYVDKTLSGQLIGKRAHVKGQG